MFLLVFFYTMLLSDRVSVSHMQALKKVKVQIFCSFCECIIEKFHFFHLDPIRKVGLNFFSPHIFNLFINGTKNKLILVDDKSENYAQNQNSIVLLF